MRVLIYPEARDALQDSRRHIDADDRVLFCRVLAARQTRGGISVRAFLRLGAYQLVFLQTPAHAAVSATVEAEVAELPHPFRAYYVEGQRSVVMAIEEILAAVERGEA